MAHHSQEPMSWDLEELQRLQKELGATNKFPQGKLTENDEGEITMAVAVQDGKVVIDFGQPTAWVGMDPQQASDLATLILKNARTAAKDSGTTLTVSL